MSARPSTLPAAHALPFLISVALLVLFASTSGAAADSAESPSRSTYLSGDFVQGGIVRGATQPGNKVHVHGRLLRVSDNGRFIFGLNRDQDSPVIVEIERADGGRESMSLDIGQREYRIQRINGLPKGKVSGFSKADLKRIRSDSSAANKARRRDDARLDWDTEWIWPATGPISGVYGSQRILNGKPRRPHFGVDIAAPTGTPVVAPAAGIVTLVRDMFFSGNTLVIDHGHNFSSSFLHLSKIHVKLGDRVEQGDLIAEIGATGRVTGPHLDWRMNLGKQRVDPAFLVPPMDEVL